MSLCNFRLRVRPMMICGTRAAAYDTFEHGGAEPGALSRVCQVRCQQGQTQRALLQDGSRRSLSAVQMQT
jgi:hypothetical protein